MWDKIKPEEMTDNVFRLINEDWMLVAAEDEGRVNAMRTWYPVGEKSGFCFCKASAIYQGIH